jgi:hypothetical protein
MTVEQALAFIAMAHAGQVDKAGGLTICIRSLS